MEACRNPCGECPFRKDSVAGYLGGFTPQHTFQTAVSESSFHCHLTRETGKEKECAGRLLFAKKSCKSFRNKELETLKDELVGKNNLNTILSYPEFISHHTT